MRHAYFQSLVVLLSASRSAIAATYSLAKDYSGPTFFDDWVFYNNFDNLTNGDVIFVSAQVAASSKLAFVDPSSGHAIVKVDNTSTVPWNDKRNSVRITTQNEFAVGSVWVADMFHVPYGCSVWPAWWSQAPSWPAGGEIDTFEGVNLRTLNQMSLHTLPGCTQVSPTQTSSLINSTDCSSSSNNNQGCIVTDPSTDSYGAAFAAAGGGVFVTEYAQTGISIWFFTRSAVPSSLSSGSNTLDTSTLGEPVANWPTTGCDMDQFFGPQNLILDITLCGDFAKPPNIFTQTCTGVCYDDWVVGNGSDYANAYFDVASIRIFNTNGSLPALPSGGGSHNGGVSISQWQTTLLSAVVLAGILL
ncbi:hypothetical protein BDN72DRAFT_835201, partial [Pluteus cervinus]